MCEEKNNNAAGLSDNEFSLDDIDADEIAKVSAAYLPVSVLYDVIDPALRGGEQQYDCTNRIFPINEATNDDAPGVYFSIDLFPPEGEDADNRTPSYCVAFFPILKLVRGNAQQLFLDELCHFASLVYDVYLKYVIHGPFRDVRILDTEIHVGRKAYNGDANIWLGSDRVNNAAAIVDRLKIFLTRTLGDESVLTEDIDDDVFELDDVDVEDTLPKMHNKNEIPEGYKGPILAVSAGKNAFSICEEITDVIIGQGAKYIGKSAFASCRSLSSVTIPSSVTSIGPYAFSYCTSLSSVTIPSSVTSIGSYAFSYCSPNLVIRTDAPRKPTNWKPFPMGVRVEYGCDLRESKSLKEEMSEGEDNFELDVGESIMDVMQMGNELGFDWVFSDEGMKVLAASGNIVDGELFTYDYEIGEKRRISLEEAVSIAPYRSFDSAFMHDLLCASFDRFFPNGIGDISMDSSDFILDRDISREFVDRLLTGDVFDLYYSEGDSDYSHTDVINDSVKSELEAYGFSRDVYDRIKENPSSDELSDERHEELKAAYACATADAMSRGAEDACMSDFDKAVDGAIPTGVSVDRDFDNGELKLSVLRGFVDSYADRIWEQLSDDCGDDDADDSDTLWNAVRATVIWVFNETFDFREPYYGWEGFDENTFNESLSARLADVFGRPATPKKEFLGEGSTTKVVSDDFELDDVSADDLFGGHDFWKKIIFSEYPEEDMVLGLLDDEYVIDTDGSLLKYNKFWGQNNRAKEICQNRDDALRALGLAYSGMLSILVRDAGNPYADYANIIVKNSGNVTAAQIDAAVEIVRKVDDWHDMPTRIRVQASDETIKSVEYDKDYAVLKERLESVLRPSA